MKKSIAIFITVLSLCATASAQKIGYIRVDDIVGMMPEVQKVNMDTIGQKFIQDSILPRYNYIQTEYQRKLADLNDTTKPAAIRAEVLKSLQEDKAELDNAQNVIQQAQQYKQNEFLQPFYQKAQKAIDAVAKEKGYAYVLSKESFIVAPETDDLTLSVLAKLNIKLPNQAPPAAAPATKPAVKN